MFRGSIIFGMLVAMLPFDCSVASSDESFLNQFRLIAREDHESFAFHNVSQPSPRQADAVSVPVGQLFESSIQPDSPLLPASYPADLICSEEICTEESGGATKATEIPLSRFRKSFFQGAYASYGTISDDPDSGIMVRTLETNGTFAIPLGSMENVITFTPYIRADLLEAAAVFDVPDSLFDTGVKMFWRRPINERLGSMLLVTPSVRSDFTTSDSAFRLFGLALLTWQWVPDTLSISGGAVYTGRDDYPVLPAMGLLWTPTPEWKFDAQFPSPRISHRLSRAAGKSETWAYLAGVFGGNTWAVTRAGGVSDELTLSDLRLVTGIEYMQSENRGVYAEIGYVFNRSLEYENIPLQQDLDSAVMMRAGISF